MAVSKKRTSRSRKRIHNRVWRAKAVKVASKAFSSAQSILTGHSKSFYYITNDNFFETN